MDDLNVNGGSYGSRPNQTKQSLRVRHVLSVEADDDVMRLYPSVSSRTLGDHLLDKETRRLGGVLHLYTQPSAWRLMRCPSRFKSCCFGTAVGRSQ
jgi:hypothetical protein